MLTQHLANEGDIDVKKAGLAGPTGRKTCAGNVDRAGRSSRVIMTNEARVLRELRIQSGLSMRKAGALIGCTDSFISHIENGRVNVPTGERLDRFLAVYGDIKQKSFYERVRKFEEELSFKDQLLMLVETLPEEKIKILLNIAKSI
jgi:transcriptional regulator with XRE-family HTH domain